MRAGMRGGRERGRRGRGGGWGGGGSRARNGIVGRPPLVELCGMLSRAQLLSLARCRLKDAETLLKSNRYDGAVYMAGYAVEIKLKARIVRTLKWTGFPETQNEFDGLKEIKVHDLKQLLRLSGRPEIATVHSGDWSEVLKWKPESRYKPAGTATRKDAEDLIRATKTILGAL